MKHLLRLSCLLAFFCTFTSCTLQEQSSRSEYVRMNYEYTREARERRLAESRERNRNHNADERKVTVRRVCWYKDGTRGGVDYYRTALCHNCGK